MTTIERPTGSDNALRRPPGPGTENSIVHRPSLWKRYTRSRALGWTLVLALLAGWQVSSLIEYVPTISSPALILETLGADLVGADHAGGDLLWALLDTLRTMSIGFVIAVPLGIGLGFLMGRVRVIWALLEPLVEIIRLHPTTAILPILILFLGLGDPMKITAFLITAIFPLLMTAYAGARSVSPTLKETAQTFQLSWWRTQWEIALPSSVPFILVGVRQALGSSLLMAVVVGMLSGNSGIGFYILEAQQSLNIRSLLAGVVTVAAIGYLFNSIFLAAEKRFTRWRKTDTAP